MNIEFLGNKNTNKSSRDGIAPTVIVDHITSGTGQSAHNWFTSPNNNESSAHFIVWEDGRVTQYVDIKDMAWSNGLKADAIPRSKSAYVRSRPGVNPNKYTISIEHAGYNGQLTPAQFKSTVELHKHIKAEVKRIFGSDILFNRDRILGHFEIDPVRKPFCPGPKFPWSELIKELNDGDGTVTPPSNSKPATSGGELLRDGDSGTDVKTLQNQLIKAGYSLPKFGADGDYGDETIQAVKAFQKAQGLSVDGIVGPATQKKLDAVIAAKSSTSVHTVVSGDTVSEIAERYHTTVSKIVSLNKLKDANAIQVGQKLKVK